MWDELGERHQLDETPMRQCGGTSLRTAGGDPADLVRMSSGGQTVAASVEFGPGGRGASRAHELMHLATFTKTPGLQRASPPSFWRCISSEWKCSRCIEVESASDPLACPMGEVRSGWSIHDPEEVMWKPLRMRVFGRRCVAYWRLGTAVASVSSARLQAFQCMLRRTC